MRYSRSTNCWLRYIYLNSAYHDGNYSHGINSSLDGGLPLIVGRRFLYSLVSPSHVILIVRRQLMILINLSTLRNGRPLIVGRQFLHSLVSVSHQLSQRFKGHLYHQKPETRNPSDYLPPTMINAHIRRVGLVLATPSNSSSISNRGHPVIPVKHDLSEELLGTYPQKKVTRPAALVITLALMPDEKLNDCEGQ